MPGAFVVLIGVLGGLPPRPHVPPPVVQVIGQGPDLVVQVGIGLAVDDPPAERDAVFQVAGDPLRYRLVGRAGFLAAAAGLIGVENDVL